MTVATPEIYRHDQFVARRQVFRLFGAGFTIMTLDGKPLVASEQAAFRLREDIRVNDSSNGGTEILRIKADRIIDFSAAYQVTDSQTGEHLGTFRRKGWSSLFRDSWEILDASGIVRGKITEDSPWKAARSADGSNCAAFLPDVSYRGRRTDRRHDDPELQPLRP